MERIGIKKEKITRQKTMIKEMETLLSKMNQMTMQTINQMKEVKEIVKNQKK